MFPQNLCLLRKYSYSQRLNNRLFRIGRIFFSKAEICDKRVYAIIAYAVSKTEHLFLWCHFIVKWCHFLCFDIILIWFDVYLQNRESEKKKSAQITSIFSIILWKMTSFLKCSQRNICRVSDFHIQWNMRFWTARTSLP